MRSGIVSKALFTSPKKGHSGEGKKKRLLCLLRIYHSFGETKQAYEHISEHCNAPFPSVNQNSLQ